MSNEELVTEILSAHADTLEHQWGNALESPKGGLDVYLFAFPKQRNELEPLLNMAVRLRNLFNPIRPEESFRSDLKAELLSVLKEAPMRANERQLIGVAVVGVGSVVSVAGLLALVILGHRRNQAA
ncbi:MAG: hypothetical protein EXR62_00315 [Chloroflexi bacterium]|nr:hypothetical protein [Chloroflexota bacterium]